MNGQTSKGQTEQGERGGGISCAMVWDLLENLTDYRRRAGDNERSWETARETQETTKEVTRG